MYTSEESRTGSESTFSRLLGSNQAKPSPFKGKEGKVAGNEISGVLPIFVPVHLGTWREGLRTKRGGGRASRVRERRRGRAEAREHAGDIPK